MRKKNKGLFLLLFFVLVFSFSITAQKNTFNVKIDKPKDVKIQQPNTVIINNKIDSQVVYNTHNSTTNKIYLLEQSGSFTIKKLVFGSPDSLTMVDINLTIRFSQPFDSAYFLSLQKDTEFNPFNKKSPIRDYYRTIAPDHKSINFKASYVQAGKLITLLAFFPNNTSGLTTIEGAGKLW